MLLTPGAGDMRIERLTYTRRRQPLFPFEPDTPFDPGPLMGFDEQAWQWPGAVLTLA